MNQMHEKITFRYNFELNVSLLTPLSQNETRLLIKIIYS